MLQKSLSKEWRNLIIDPYAMLGVSVNADERNISKRYYVLAKQLHPDNYINNDKPDRELAQAVFTQLINPAYEQLKQTKNRLEVIALLRSEAKSLDKQKAVAAQTSIIQVMSTMSAQEAELFYEDVVKSYASAQYHSMQQAYQVTQQLSALNIVYLSCQQTKNPLGNQPQSITTQEETTAIQNNQEENTLIQNNSSSGRIFKADLINYAHRHYERAVDYSKKELWNLAVQELRDAIKLDTTNADYYALLGVVHFNQKFIGMAKVYIRQALKINPQQPLALKYAKLLQIQTTETVAPQSMVKALGIASLLSRFLSNDHK
jgi:curved DNA-binding protein CbpA